MSHAPRRNTGLPRLDLTSFSCPRWWIAGFLKVRACCLRVSVPSRVQTVLSCVNETESLITVAFLIGCVHSKVGCARPASSANQAKICPHVLYFVLFGHIDFASNMCSCVPSHVHYCISSTFRHTDCKHSLITPHSSDTQMHVCC